MNLGAETDYIPEGWTHAMLGETARLVSGAGFPLEHQGKKGLKYPFFKVGNLGEVESGTPLETAPDSIDDDLAKLLGAKIIEPNTVLFAKTGWLSA